MGTLTSALKALFSSAKTTGTHVPLVQSDGTPDGCISMNNLASVLGEKVTGRFFSDERSFLDWASNRDVAYGLVNSAGPILCIRVYYQYRMLLKWAGTTFYCATTSSWPSTIAWHRISIV